MRLNLHLPLLSIIFCFIIFPKVYSQQLLPPNQPEQDACNALLICGNSFTSPYGYQGIGQVNDLNNTPCGSGEGNSLWLRLEVNTPGTIVFTIEPTIITDDYDMAVIDITNKSCSNFNTNDVIRCNFNNNNPTFNNGITGLNMTSTLHFVTGGTTGSSYLEYIDASAGDVYLIMINNFGTGFTGPQSGFTIDFTGSTATFNQNPAPQFDEIVPSCDNADFITLKLTEYVLCSSIASDGSDFSIHPSGTIQSVSSSNCGTIDGYTDEIVITFANTLAPGNYTLKAETGTDGNTLLGICSEELEKPDSLNFTVGGAPILISSIDSPACQFLNLHLSSPIKCNSIAANGSDFKINGPENRSVISAEGVNCTNGMTNTILVNIDNPIATDGNYEIEVKVGTDGNTLIDDCHRLVPEGEKHPFIINSYNGMLTSLPDSNICHSANVIQLGGINNAPAPSGGFAYKWSPANNVDNPNDLNTTANIGVRSRYTFHLETIDANGCYLRDSNVVNISFLHGELIPRNPIICDGDSILMEASGGIKYLWANNASFTSGLENLSCLNCPSPYAFGSIGTHTIYVVVEDELGCTDTLFTDIVVKEEPQITIHPSDTTIKYGKSVQLNASGASEYVWYPIESLNYNTIPNPISTPEKTTLYEVTGIDKYGCMNTEEAIVRVEYDDEIFLPNSFTPNNDGLNDRFKIRNLQYQKLISFQIFNRYGNMVYSSSNPEEGWDGNYNGKEAPSGVYMYVIELAYPNNEIRTLTGDLSLLR